MIAYSRAADAIGTLLVLAAFWAAVCGAPGIWFGSQRGRLTEGFWLGVLLGPAGWLFALLLPPSQKWLEEREHACELARCRARAEHERKNGGGVKTAQDSDEAEFARWRAAQS